MRCPRFVTLLTFTLSLHHTSVTAVTHRAYYLTRERPSVVLGWACHWGVPAPGRLPIARHRSMTHGVRDAQAAYGRPTVADSQLASMATYWRD
jgi:hypothetical protein